MGELRPGWTRVKFGEVVRLVKQTCKAPLAADIDRVIGLEHLEPGDLRIRSWASVADGTTFTTRVRPGQVLFGKRRAYQRKVAVAEFDAVCSGDIYVFESADPTKLLPDLLPFICQTEAFFEHAVGTSAGSLSPRTSWDRLVVFAFYLPPLNEQLKLSRLLRAAESSAQALLDASTGLGKISRRLLEAFGLESMPRVRVDELLLEPPRNGLSPLCNADMRGRPTLPVGCVYSGIVDTNQNLKFAEISSESFARFKLQRDDVLVVRGNGNRELVGRGGIVVENNSGCFYPDLLIRLRFDSAKLMPALAVQLWNCVPVHAGLVRKSKSTNGIYKINGDDIRTHMLPLPPPATQRAMIDAVEKHVDSTCALRARLQHARDLKAGVLSVLGVRG